MTVAIGVAPARASLLSPIGTFASQGSGAGELQAPAGVAVDQQRGVVFVADSANARVEKFDQRGEFLAAWGWGVVDGRARSEICRGTERRTQHTCLAGIPGSAPGQFSDPTSVAVGAATGAGGRAPEGPATVYVGDAGNSVVEKFDSNGRFLGTIDGSSTPQGQFFDLAAVAVDQRGDLWTANGIYDESSRDDITEFDPGGKFVRQWGDGYARTVALAVDSANDAVYATGGQGNTARWTLTGRNETVIDNPSSTNGTALSVDLQSGNLYVDHGAEVAMYDRAGTRIDTLTLASTANSQGLGFRSSAGKSGQRDRLYVADASADDVTIFGPPSGSGRPLITAESAMEMTKSTATLRATVVPLGHGTTCEFQYVDDADFQMAGYSRATTVACTPADLGSSFAYQEPSVSLSGLTPNATYHFRVVAANRAGTATGADQTLEQVFAWAPFTRCPVDDPALLATDSSHTEPACLGASSPHGSIAIGNTTATTGNTNLQAGLVYHRGTGVFSVVSPAGGAIIADPVQIPALGVTAVVESAGAPSNFRFGLRTGRPILTLPVMIHLESTTLPLGPSCYIGSDHDPIVLRPQPLDLSNAIFYGFLFDPNGVPDPNGPDQANGVTGAVVGDDAFAVPTAHGCGPGGSLDAAVDAIVGLPSPPGRNHLVLDATSSGVVTAYGETGQEFSGDWHAGLG